MGTARKGPSPEIGTLGDSESRLRKFLQLRGDVGLEMGHNVIPVVVVGNATTAGYLDNLERRFSFGDAVAAAVGFTSKYALKAIGSQQALVIDRLWLSTGAAAVVRVSWLAPTAADPFAIATTGVLWDDRLNNSTEIAPVVVGSNNADATTPGQTLWQQNLPAGGTPFPLDLPVHLLPGAKLIVYSQTVNVQLNVAFQGRAV